MLNWYSGQVLLNYSEHADLGWSCSNIAALGHQQAWIPISLNEMAEASAYLPIAILRYQQRWYIVGVANDIYLSNTQISDLAQLNHKFVPQCIQLYPFCLMPPDCSQVSSKDGVQLGIDWRCLVPLKEKGTMPLFDKNRQFSSVVMNRLYLLYRLKIDGEIVHSACELLERKGLLVLISKAERMIGNIVKQDMPLYRVDIDAISRLSREDFADLQMHHAMELAAYQHSSLFHMEGLHCDAN